MTLKNSVLIFFLFHALTSCSFTFNPYKSKIDGEYIPKNLDDALDIMEAELSESTRLKIMEMTEEEFVTDSHFDSGLEMRSSWKLWKKSRLYKSFLAKKIWHPDDISSIIITSFYRRINGIEIKLEEQIGYYHEYWAGVELVALPRKNKYPEKNLEFSFGKIYGNFTENKKWATVYIQTNSKTNLHWIYDYYYGWKQITTKTKTMLEDSLIENTEEILDQIFN